jgi:hypothetical protein
LGVLHDRRIVKLETAQTHDQEEGGCLICGELESLHPFQHGRRRRKNL